MKKTAQVSSWDAALSYPVMGETFCFPISRILSAKEVKVLPPKVVSHFPVRSAASDPTKGERSGNKNIFRASYTLSGSFVWKASAITMTATAWEICSGRKHRLSAVRL